MPKIFRLIFAIAFLASSLAAQQVEVRINQRLSSESSPVGTAFTGSLARPVLINGRSCPQGSAVRGTVVESKRSGRLSSPGVLALQPSSITCSGRRIPLTADPVVLEGRSHTKRNAVLIGGGAAAGALLGGLIGGGKGALIGAGVGAGSGTVGAAAGGRHEAVIEPEAVIAWNVRTASTPNVSPRDDSHRSAYSERNRHHDDDGDDDRDDDRYERRSRRGDHDRDAKVYVFTEDERSYLRSCLASNYRLPPGLAKKGKIPPGHAKKMQQAAYGDPIPYACTARLSPIPHGWERVIIDERVILRDAAHRVIDYFIWRD
ncbi:MAG: hypothetical protein ACE14L_15855 [Terriglobales bacterium]